MKQILWLAEWLPSRVEAYAGDFIERHAQAAAIYNDIEIILVQKDPTLKKRTIDIEQRIYHEHCRASILYYPALHSRLPLIDKVHSAYWFFRLHFKAIREYENRRGRPDGIQVNITMKNGIIALLYKWLRRIPYIVTESWSIFLPEANPSLPDKPALFRWAAKKVLKGSALLVTVSDHLGQMMCRQLKLDGYKKVPNVVDQTVFYPAPAIPDRTTFRLIHISTLSFAKQPETMLKAIKLVVDRGKSIELRIHGPIRDEWTETVQALQLEHQVTFLPECPQSELGRSIRECHALLLFSRYETFGMVLIEANACGLPVIVSDYPTFDEIVIEGVNGIKAQGKDAIHLADAICRMIDHYDQFDREKIVQMTLEKYNYSVVGAQFDAIYKEQF